MGMFQLSSPEESKLNFFRRGVAALSKSVKRQVTHIAQITSPEKNQHRSSAKETLSQLITLEFSQTTPTKPRSESYPQLPQTNRYSIMGEHSGDVNELKVFPVKHLSPSQKSIQHISDRTSSKVSHSVSSFYGESVISINNPFMFRSSSTANTNGRVNSLTHSNSLNSKKPSKSKSRSFSNTPEPSRLRSNSCSTLFIDQTITKLDKDTVLRNISHVLHNQFEMFFALHPPGSILPISDPLFDEFLHPLTSRHRVPSDYAVQLPSVDSIHRFLDCFFNAALLEGEVALVAMVYVTRLQKNSGLVLMPSNWKWVVIGCVLAAAKVWDDMAVWVNDFKTVLPACPLEHFNRLERHILRDLQFDVNVSPKEYAEHYFDLRMYSMPTRRSSTRVSRQPPTKSSLKQLSTHKIEPNMTEERGRCVYKRYSSCDGMFETFNQNQMSKPTFVL